MFVFPYPCRPELALFYFITVNIGTLVLEKSVQVSVAHLKDHIKLCFPAISASVPFSSVSTKLAFSKDPVKFISYVKFNGCWFLEPSLEEWSK